VDREQADRLGEAFNASVGVMLGGVAVLLLGFLLLVRRSLQARTDDEIDTDAGFPSPPDPRSGG
jgi:hypothetical protein